jgi:hypothetical protein
LDARSAAHIASYYASDSLKILEAEEYITKRRYHQFLLGAYAQRMMLDNARVRRVKAEGEAARLASLIEELIGSSTFDVSWVESQSQDV